MILQVKSSSLLKGLPNQSLAFLEHAQARSTNVQPSSKLTMSDSLFRTAHHDGPHPVSHRRSSRRAHGGSDLEIFPRPRTHRHVDERFRPTKPHDPRTSESRGFLVSLSDRSTFAPWRIRA